MPVIGERVETSKHTVLKETLEYSTGVMEIKKGTIIDTVKRLFSGWKYVVSYDNGDIEEISTRNMNKCGSL